jgi:hypothetical protein
MRFAIRNGEADGFKRESWSRPLHRERCYRRPIESALKIVVQVPRAIFAHLAKSAESDHRSPE